MLVINANNQQDTTNYMLTDQGYPDLDSILMRGGPQLVKQIIGNTTETWQGINDSPVIDTIGTEPINFYCPKFYKSGLRQGNISRTSFYLDGSNWFNIPIDFWSRTTANSSYYYQVTGDTGYRIAVKWLWQGQIVGEKIYAPLMFVHAHIWPSSWYIQGTLSITFWLLHSDGTKTTIATITPTRVGGTEPYDSSYLLKSGTWQYQAIITALRAGSYNGTWQTAQDGDILYADVIISGLKIMAQSSSTNVWMGGGICFWGTNNNSIWDLNWFRPFQVSIRDS